MKIELPSGAMIHLDSAEELETALRVLQGNKLVSKTIDPTAKQADEEQRVRALFQNINQNARKFLVTLAGFPNGIQGEEFAEKSGFSSYTWGGTMGGIKKQAELQSLHRESFVISEMRSQQAKRYRYLVPGPLLIKFEIELHKITKKREDKGQIAMGA